MQLFVELGHPRTTISLVSCMNEKVIDQSVVTTGNRHFAECRKLCRVYFIGHSVKTALPSVFSALGKDGFAECLFSGTRQRCILPSAIFWHSAKYVFAECLFFGTRQRGILPSAFFGTRQRGILPCAFFFSPRQIIFSKQFLRP